MTEHDDQKDRSWRLLLFGLAPIVYVLSIGPAAWMQQHGFVNGAALQVYAVVYYPLSLIVIYVPGFRPFMEWYLPLWIG